MSQQKYPKAYEAYQQAVYRDGRNPTFWCSIGVLYYQINQYRDALDAYSRAIRLNPNISEVWYDLGTLYESCNNQTSDALDAYTRAADLDSTSKHAWRCLRVSPPMASLTRPAHLCRRTSTPRRISRAHLVVLQVSHGEHRRTTARLLGQRHHLLPLATTGEATGSQSSRTPQDRRSLSTHMTLVTACHSRSHPWHLVDPARLDKTRFVHTRSLSVLRRPLIAACLRRLKTSNLLRSSLRRRTYPLNIPLLARRKAHRSSSSSSLQTRASHCSAKAAVLHPMVSSHRRATLRYLASTVSQALARRLDLWSTTRRPPRADRSLARLTSTMRTRACRRLQAAHLHHQTRNSQLTLPHATERRDLVALHQSAFANGKTTTVSSALRPRTHAPDWTKSRCNAPLRNPSRCLLRPIAVPQK
jgi:hypothetical protein